MNKRIVPFTFLGSVLLFTFLGSPAMAQGVQRTFVSGSGSDGNPCSRAAPCRTFAQAISQTNAGGEVVALDSAGYGPFTISQSVTVQAAPGAYAGISVFSGDGIDINAGPSDVVVLRGLTVNGQGGINGIVQIAGGTLHIENCVVNGFSAFLDIGIAFNGPGRLHVNDSTVRGNNTGIAVASASGTALGSIENVRLKGNVVGLFGKAGSTLDIRNSVASENNAVGIVAAGSAVLNIESCMLSGNGRDGLFAESGGLCRVSNSIVTDNGGIGLEASTGVILSRGNNTVEGNTGGDLSGVTSYSAK